MIFLWPSMLVFLLLIPVGVLLYVRLQRRRQRFAATFGSLGLVREAGRRPGIRRHIPPALFLLGLTILILALARPHTLVHLPRVEGTVILLFDVSGSMVAEDVQPNRLEAAKAAAREFVLRQPPSVRIGVVAFSDSGFAVQAPSNQQEVILASIDRLKPQRGTSLAYGMIASINTIAADFGVDLQEQPTQDPAQQPGGDPSLEQMPEGQFPSAVIVMISDGENNEDPDPIEVAHAAEERRVRIHTVGVGTTQGTVLEVDGFSVHSRLDENLLQSISQITGGEYYNANNQQDLSGIYDKVTPQFVIRPEQIEVTAIFAGASLAILLVSGLLSLWWFSRLP